MDLKGVNLFLRLQVKLVREENDLQEKTKGKTREGASERVTIGDLRSHRKMFNLIQNTFPQVTVSPVGIHDNTIASCSQDQLYTSPTGKTRVCWAVSDLTTAWGAGLRSHS